MSRLSAFLVRLRGLGATLMASGLLALALPTAATAETLMMPNRDMLAGTPEVVWGITTLPNGAATTYRIDFGDGTSVGPTTVTDRSFIAVNKTYASSGVFVATLTVTNGGTTETATVSLNVYNSATLSAFDLRNLNVNRAIQDGLRYLWTSQANRTTFDTNAQTFWDWGSFDNPGTALAVLAFQNHGYQLPNSDAVPTGIYQKYAVARGFNYVLARLTSQTVAPTPQGDNPCVGLATNPCSALFANTTFDPGYENGIIALPLAGSGALNRTINGVAANVNGQTFGEVLQRIVNASIWGQNDASGTSPRRGGWVYTFNSTSSDNSTNGWQLLSLLDAEAAGVVVPQWVRNEWAFALAAGQNNDGSADYQANGNRASASSPNVAKAGVGVQGMFFAGRLDTDPDLALAKTYIGTRWNEANPTSLGTTQGFACSGNGRFNKGCAYGMFNVFKGFKLYGIPTLAGVNRPAGPGSIPSDDWYADYVDWLLANQTNPTTPTGGNWNALSFSSQTTNGPASASLALLILAPTALVLPDPPLFSTVGLRHGNPLTTAPQTNPVTTPPGTHTVTATTTAPNSAPIAGVTVTFRVISGPNIGATGTGTTAANGQVTFTYTGTGGAGTDNIRAFVGNLESNVLVKNWVVVVSTCDVDADNDIDVADLGLIRAGFGAVPAPGDPRDATLDGKITMNDVRACTLRCTRASCAAN
jgi:hypothetical protein